MVRENFDREKSIICHRNRIEKNPTKTVSSKYFKRLPLIGDTDVGDVNVTDIMSVIVPFVDAM